MNSDRHELGDNDVRFDGEIDDGFGVASKMVILPVSLPRKLAMSNLLVHQLLYRTYHFDPSKGG